MEGRDRSNADSEKAPGDPGPSYSGGGIRTGDLRARGVPEGLDRPAVPGTPAAPATAGKAATHATAAATASDRAAPVLGGPPCLRTRCRPCRTEERRACAAYAAKPRPSAGTSAGLDATFLPPTVPRA